MKRNGRKGKRTLTMDHGMHGVKRKKKAEGDECNSAGQQSSKKTARFSRQQKSFDRRKVNQELGIQKNLRSNCSESNGRFMNQLLEENVKTCDEIGIQENPNQIFLSEDFSFDDNDDSKSNSGPTVATEQPDGAPSDNVDWHTNSEPKDKVETFSKFTGISKIIRIYCSMCKISLENLDDNYLRYARNCLKCQSPILFQCRKCKTFYKQFQSIWDHVERSCRLIDINPSIRELALKESDHIYSFSEQTSNQMPTVTTLDSDNEDEKTNDNFVNPPTTLPIRIKSIESLCNFEEKSTTDPEPVVNDTKTGKITAKDRPTKNKKIKSKTTATSSASKYSKKDDYKCHKCEFKAESANEVKNHIANVHSVKDSKNDKCWRCRNSYRSYKHQKKCWKRNVIRYNCKFCKQTFEVLYALKKHLTAKHSQLFKSYEMDGIIVEIKLKRNAVKEMFEKACEEKIIEANEYKNSDKMSKIENDVDEKIVEFSRINEFLRIRCCKCKVTFEKVEEKVILSCPDCKSELLYRCRLCDKFFAFFDEAWLHISYKCELLDINKTDHTHLTPKKIQIMEVVKPPEVAKPPKVVEPPEVVESAEPTYNCSHCDYKTTYKWQISQHLNMWHSYPNGDPEIEFTACSRCGLTFEKPEHCKTHEKFHCGKEKLLFCEFCPRAERRVDAMRIHLVKMHSRQVGSTFNLEDIIDVIKRKRKNMNGINAFLVPNERDSYTVVEEV